MHPSHKHLSKRGIVRPSPLKRASSHPRLDAPKSGCDLQVPAKENKGFPLFNGTCQPTDSVAFAFCLVEDVPDTYILTYVRIQVNTILD